MRTTRVLILCYANRWRSPLAAAFLKRHATYEVKSAGFAKAERSAGKLVREAARKHGLDLKSHRSKTLTNELYSWADIILVAGGTNRFQEFLKGQPIKKDWRYLGMYVQPPRISIPDLAFQHGAKFAETVEMIEMAIAAFVASEENGNAERR